MNIHEQSLANPHRYQFRYLAAEHKEIKHPWQLDQSVKLFCEVCGWQMTPGRPCPNCGASQC